MVSDVFSRKWFAPEDLSKSPTIDWERFKRGHSFFNFKKLFNAVEVFNFSVKEKSFCC